MTWNMRTKAKAAADTKLRKYAQGGPVPDYAVEAGSAATDVADAVRPKQTVVNKGPTPQNLRNMQWENAVQGKERAERDRKARGSY